MITLVSTRIIQDDSPISRIAKSLEKPFLQIREHSQVPEINAWDILGTTLPYTIFFSVRRSVVNLFPCLFCTH